MSDDGWGNGPDVENTTDKGFDDHPQSKKSSGSGWGDEPQAKDTSGTGWDDKPQPKASVNEGWGEEPESNNVPSKGWNKPQRDNGGGTGNWNNKPPFKNNNSGEGWNSRPPRDNNSSKRWNDRPPRNNDGNKGWNDESNNTSSKGWNDKPKADNSGNTCWGDELESNTTSSKSKGWDDKSQSDNMGTKRWADKDDSNDNSKKFKKEGDDEDAKPFMPEELNLDEEKKQIEGSGVNFQRYNDQKVTCFPPNLIEPVQKFEDIVASELLLSNLKSQKYSDMTPIQKWAMPAIMAGHDLIGCAETGSGKTAAFLLPVLQNLLNSDLEPQDPNSVCQNPYCLIISPTRELANQIHVHANLLSRDSIIKCHVIYGQIATNHLKAKLQTGCHILVATIGRLKDFVNRGWIGFSNIRYIILDEGDRLVDDGFSADVKGFFEHETMPPKEKRQTLFFSATFKEETQLQAKSYLKDQFIFLTVGRIGAANLDIKQEFLKVTQQEKKRELKKILLDIPQDVKTIVFTQTKTAADILACFFSALNLSSTSIHGDRHQSQREQAIKAFKKGEKRFLISSPVGNRGLDLPNVSLVINYDLPKDIDEYVHRIGRTGRAGHTGRALSFYDEERDSEILPHLIEILKEAKQEIPDWMPSGSSKLSDDKEEIPESVPQSSPKAADDQFDDWGNTW